MALEIFGAVATRRWAVLRLRQDGRAFALRAREVGIDVVDEDRHAVDDPRHGRPPACAFARLAMAPRRLVIGGWRREHDHAVAGLHLAVRESAVVFHAASLDEAEHTCEPVERRETV